MKELIGYYTYEICQEARGAFVNACLQYGVEPSHIREADGRLTFRVIFYQAGAMDAILKNSGISYGKEKLAGMGGRLLWALKHPGFIVGVILSVLMYGWLTGMVWEVRIVTETDIDDDRTRQILKECGLHEGSRLSRIDVDEIAADYLLKDERSAFVAVHINGVVAEVEIISHDIKEEPVKPVEPCNIVASCDALITDITVYSGKPLVTVGQTVRAGDVLVSGVVTDAGGTRLVAASADIRGQVSETFKVSVPKTISQTVVADRSLRGVNICLFGKVFSYGQREMYVEETERLYLFNRIRTPLEFTWFYEVETVIETRELSNEEQISRAEVAVEAEMATRIGDGALLKSEKNTKEAADGVYLTEITIVFENNIGKSLAFAIENN